MTRHRTLSWIAWSVLLQVRGEEAGLGCGHPPVPAGGRYVNVTGGLGQDSWAVRYSCDTGYELFGEERATCRGGDWPGDLPLCATNVAKYKPAVASSEAGEGLARNAVDGVPTIVHEGRKCTETKQEKSPWWTVDLLTVQAVKHVRITTRCCDDLPIKNVEIRVGNSTTYKDNPLCNWLPGKQKEGDTILVECVSEDTAGRYVSLLMTGPETVLTLCEVEVFSPRVLATSSCHPDLARDQLAVYEDSCFWFVDEVRREAEAETTDVLGFTEASEACEGAGYHLVDEIDSVGAAFIKTRLEAEGRAGSGSMVWLGARRDTGPGARDTWHWVSGRTVRHIFWGEGQPNNYNKEQNCAVLDSQLDWRWNDLSCKVDAKTVCRGHVSTCPAPRVAAGTWYTGNLTVGSTIQYHCPLGHMPVGEATQVCRTSGQWSGQPITCQFVDCGNVPGLLHGAIHVLDGRTTWGARVKYECNTDYSPRNGDEGRVCGAAGWSGAAPTCEYTRCPAPARVPNSRLKEIPGEAGSSRLGAKVIYTCEAGHVARGSLSRECLLGGAWSGSEPSCEFVDCGAPPELLHGAAELVDSRTTYSAGVTYTCGDDYTLNGETKIRCEADGKWTRAKTECEIIKCPAPRAPNGGRVSGYNYEVHKKVEYSCLPGHQLLGDPVLECLRSGDWSLNPPRCKYIDCEKVPLLKGGKVHYANDSTHLDSVILYKCDRNYRLEGAARVACLESGAWSAPPPACTEIRCPAPAKINNTIFRPSTRGRITDNTSFGVGTILNYRCERGFLLEGGARVVTRRCSGEGAWSGRSPSCSYVDCGVPELVTNGEFKLQNNGTSYGAFAHYECQPGFKLKGFARRSCKAEGVWEPESPECEETLCPALVTPEHAVMNLTTLRIGGAATFSCEHGYKLLGAADIHCLSSGSWSGWPPGCVEVDCGQPLTVENSRMFLVNDSSTKYGALVEYLCFPGFTRDGPFQRRCEISGQWSGQDPVCYVASRLPAPTSSEPSNSLPRDGDNNVTGGNQDNDNGNIGVWIGVALGLISVLGIIFVGIYFYRKQMHLHSKPARDTNQNGLGVLGVPSYAMGSYGGAAAGQIGARPPPPIQMYSIDDTPDNEDHRGPIYDTINDDNSSHSQSSYSQSGSGGSGGGSDTAAGPYSRSTFTPGDQAHYNGGYSNEYDVPEGNERLSPHKIKSPSVPTSVGVVTINGIAV